MRHRTYQPQLRIMKIVDDPHDPTRVILTDTARNRHNCQVAHLAGQVEFTDDVDLGGTTRIGWDG